MKKARKRIVLAGDDFETTGLLTAIIAQIDKLIKVDFVGNGRQLMLYLSACDTIDLPCLVILDLKMPYQDGVSELKRLQQFGITKDMPVIVWSTNLDTAIIQTCLHSGAAACLVKPEKPSELKIIAHQLLEFCR